MKKIAFVSGYYVDKNSKRTINENTKLSIDFLHKSAKKYFLKNHNVDFIFLTNGNIEIEGVKNIKFDYDIDGYWHACLMKIISLNYIENNYDYIFVTDNDSLYIDYIGDEILESDIVILDHFYKPTLKSIYDEITDRVPLDFDYGNEKWTMGNFFGGKFDIMKQLAEYTEQLHFKYYQPPFNPNYHFYTKYPEEIFLLKFIFENKINHRRLTSVGLPLETKEKYFLGDFQEDSTVYSNLTNVKLLHNTKKNYDTLKKIIENYI